MSRRTTLMAVLSAPMLAGLALAAAGGPAGASVAPSYTAMAGSAPAFATASAASGTAASTQKLTFQVWMKPDIAAAQAYAASVSKPGSKTYRHYLSPNAYTAQYGASASAVSQVEAWLKSEGFTGVTTGPDRNYVRATGAVSSINTAFRTQIENYRSTAAANADGYQLFANDKAVSIPSSLAGLTLGVTGLTNAAPKLPLVRDSSNIKGSSAKKVTPDALGDTAPCSGYYGEKIVKGYPKKFGRTSFATDVCGYSATQIRGAYGASMSAKGTGQTIALVELGLVPDMFQTLQDYAKANAMPAPSPSRYEELSLGEGSTCGNFDVEEQLDVETSYDMAPGANQIVVGGDSCNDGDYGAQGLFDADLAVLGGSGQHPLASAASNSWEVFDEDQPPADSEIEHAYLVQAADEGVGMYFSAGDDSGVEEPSADPWAISVGGTTLGISKTNTRLFETGWSTGYSALTETSGKYSWVFQGEASASGGGPAGLWAEPAYQQGVVPASLTNSGGDNGPVRSAPDISADADPFTGFAVGILETNSAGNEVYTEGDVGGTSESSPLVAGMVIAGQQGQSAPFGFIDPAIYKMVGTSALYDPVPVWMYNKALYDGVVCSVADCGLAILTTFDDQSTSMFGYTGQVTLRGYDNMTGVGVPNEPNFIRALRG